MSHPFRAAALAVALVTAAACNPEQRETVDSAAGAAEDVVRASLAVLNVDMGRHATPEKDVTDETDTFAPSDTIYASIRTTGTARDDANVIGRWIFPDSSVVDNRADRTTVNDETLLFFLAKPEGLATGKYTFQVIVDGREVRSKEVTVQ